ncbi:MAG TPA: MerR family transcriptional regulator [Pseudonocardia sp.]
MAELSDRSGVPVATIKYYLREGLLPPGERTGPNQARYGSGHVRRLRLVRALLDVGGLSVAAVREVLAAVDTRAAMHGVLGLAQRNLELRAGQVDEQAKEWAVERVQGLAARRGWPVKPDDPVVESLVATLATLHSLGRTELVDRLDSYAELADRMAELDLSTLGGLPDRETVVEAAVVGTVLGDTLFAALRRLAQHHASARSFGDT